MKFTGLLKKKTQKFIIIMQKVLIPVLLVLTYLVGFGLTLVFILLFNKKIIFGKGEKEDTYWLEAKGYEADTFDGMKQS